MDNSTLVLYHILACLPIIALILSLASDFLFYTFGFYTIVDAAQIINGIMKIFLVIILLVIEFAQVPVIVKGFSFMFYFAGRGVFYMILGFIILTDISSVGLAGGIIMIVSGAVYFVLHFAARDYEPEYMSFIRYQRLTSGVTHELPTHTGQQNTYPVSDQIPLPEHSTGSIAPVSPIPVDTDTDAQTKTEV